LDLSRDVTGMGAWIESGNIAHTRLACDEGFPEGVFADAVGCHDAEAGDYDATGFSHQLPPFGLNGSARCRANRKLPYHKYGKILRDLLA